MVLEQHWGRRAGSLGTEISGCYLPPSCFLWISGYSLGAGGRGGGGIRPRPTPQNVSEESEVNHSSVTDKRWASSTLNVLPFSLVEI